MHQWNPKKNKLFGFANSILILIKFLHPSYLKQSQEITQMNIQTSIQVTQINHAMWIQENKQMCFIWISNI